MIELQDPSAGSDYTRGDEPSEELPEPTGPSAPSGPYEPGPLISPHIRRQLEQRRGRFAAAWRRDPARETALLALLILSLVAILAVGVALKESLFLRSGFDPEQSFWMESAQRFRYIREVAGGGAIPELDTQMQAPDGYVPRSDTVLQEIVLGKLYGWLAPEEVSLTAFVRRMTRLLNATAIFPVALLCFGLTRRRDAALVGALAWAVALPVAERGLGVVIFREDLAVPVLLWHLGFLALWARNPRVLSALLSGVFLAGSLLLWKVSGFYMLLLVGFLSTAHVLGREEPGRLLLGTIALLVPPGLACLLPLNLQHESFVTSTAMLAGVSVAVAMAGDLLVSRRAGAGVRSFKRRIVWLPAALLVFAGLRFALPSEVGYDHAWQTIVAKIRFLGAKPDDPGLLSFHARHYWTGNYESPTLRLLARTWPWLALAALPGLLRVLAWQRPDFARSWQERERVPTAPPTRLLDGWGPAEPLFGLGGYFVLWLTVSMAGSYLLFRKFQLLMAIPLVALIAIGYAAPRVRKTLHKGALLLLVGLLAAQSRGLVPDLGELLDLPPQSEPGAASPVVVHSAASFDELARALPDLTHPDEAILASFVISPFILAYLDRPTVLHCFFEGDVLERYQRITGARFADEEVLWDTARSYQARWYVHEAHHLLRTDGRMSPRYVADQLDRWPQDSALVRMQFAPQELRRFELAWENDYFRVFRVLDEGQRPRHESADPQRPLWNRHLFASLFGDPLGAVDESAALPLEPSDLLYTTLVAGRAIARSRADFAVSPSGSAYVERDLQEALRIAPYLSEADALLADFYGARGRQDRAAEHRERARKTRAAMVGQAPFGDDLKPLPVPIRGE